MRQHSSLIAFLGMLTLLIGSCSQESDSAKTSENSPSPVASQAASPTTVTEKPFSKPPLVAKKSTVTTTSSVKVASLSPLIQSTNPDQRVRQVQKGRPDPFALVPVQPIVTVKPLENGTTPSTTSPTTSGTTPSTTSPTTSGTVQSPRPVPTVPSLTSSPQPKPGIQPPVTASKPPRSNILPPPPTVPRVVARVAARPQANNPSVSSGTPKVVNVPRSPAPPKIVNVPRSPAPPKVVNVPPSTIPSPDSYVPDSNVKVQAKTKNPSLRSVQPQSPSRGGLVSTVGKRTVSRFGSSIATSRVARIGTLFVAAGAVNPSSSNQQRSLPRSSSQQKSGSPDVMAFKMEAVVGVTPASLAKANVVPRPSSRLAAAPKKPAQPTKKTTAKGKPPAKAATAAKGKPPAKAATVAKGKPPAKAATVAKGKPPAKAATVAKGKPPAKAATVAKGKPPAKAATVAKGKPPAKAAARPKSPTAARNAVRPAVPPQINNAATPSVFPAAPSAVGLGTQLGTPGLPSNSTLPTIPAPIFRPELPRLPEPDLARAVSITGVVQIGDSTQAIVKAPNETSSRYVKPGDRISNGQILIKRIDMNEGPTPIVVLEQYGIEVPLRVGDNSPTISNLGQPGG
jgi:hypothetical protein